MEMSELGTNIKEFSNELSLLDCMFPSNSVARIVDVPKLEGVFIIKNALTPDECIRLRRRVMDVCASDPNNIIEDRKERRRSQIHTPCYVTKEELAPLAKRLRPLVESRVPTAGPGNDCPLDSSDSYLSTFLR